VLHTIWCIGIELYKNDGDIFVVDRDKGNPIEGASVKAYNSYWDNTTSKNKIIETGKYTTNEMGFITIKNKLKESSYNTILLIHKNGDTLISGGNSYYFDKVLADARTNDEVEKNNAQIHFFTDRSIYRPGQNRLFLKAL
jgi:uncharacterized protein YfaS (alpha-2-macroglobulin family)